MPWRGAWRARGSDAHRLCVRRCAAYLSASLPIRHCWRSACDSRFLSRIDVVRDISRAGAHAVIASLRISNAPHLGAFCMRSASINDMKSTRSLWRACPRHAEDIGAAVFIAAAGASNIGVPLSAWCERFGISWRGGGACAYRPRIMALAFVARNRRRAAAAARYQHLCMVDQSRRADIGRGLARSLRISIARLRAYPRNNVACAHKHNNAQRSKHWQHLRAAHSGHNISSRHHRAAARSALAQPPTSLIRAALLA